MRVYISRPSASNPRAFRIATAASPVIVFSFLIAAVLPLEEAHAAPRCSRRGDGGELPLSPIFFAIARMSS